MDDRTGGVQFAAEGVVVTKLAMVRFGVCIGGSADVLKFTFCQGRLISRQGV